MHKKTMEVPNNAAPLNNSSKHSTEIIIDTLIINAELCDGSGYKSIQQDVAIKGDKIIAIGDLKHWNATTLIDGEGLLLAPGFIDVHTHDDLEVLRNPQMHNKISQGVTSVIVGNCGISASPYQSDKAPIDPINLLGKPEEFCFPNLQAYVTKFKQIKPFINVAALVGHTSLRAQVMDSLDRAATPVEIEQMVLLLRSALEQGAKGFSTGLAYHNANCAPTEEVQALVQLLGDYSAIYSTHLRTEFDGIIDALDEAFSVGKKAEVPVVISHLKCAGKNNWGRAGEILNHIESNQQNQHISCDCYPYNASSSTLDLAQVTEDFEVYITWSEPHPEKAQQTLAAIAEQWQVSLLEAAKRLQPAGAVYHGMFEEDVRTIMRAPYSMIGSDGLPCDPHPHPRLWGTFPRVLGHYCRDENVLALAQGIHKMTGLSATEFKLNQRGFIREGYFADLVLFDPETIKDVASFTNPVATSKGIKCVWVNGQLSYENNAAVSMQGAGRFLTHNEVC
ncbi:D-aminoacylase [Colwellia sp. D2M02]|uniref:N-acyl-D-amino-acid deacylase family protein n=1 Tax=Colwellia sp. D2M02 TaxID=2841562 RepID=UPI00339D75F5